MRRIAWGLGLAALMLAPAAAQTTEDAEFQIWCLDVAREDAPRCAANDPELVAAYQRFRERTAEFENEMKDKRERERLLSERVDRMGEVSPDNARDVMDGRRR